MAENTKIKWTDYTWNPVWGCKAACFYCYARSIAKRFGKQMVANETEYRILNGIPLESKDFTEDIQYFKPFFFTSRFKAEFPKKAKKIFVNSMSDVAFWDKNWIDSVLIRINQHPEISFQILTKFPEKLQKFEFPENVWLGYTMTTRFDLDNLDTFKKIKAGKKFISFEPLLDNSHISKFIYMNYEGIDWVIIGTITGAKSKRINIDLIKIKGLIFNIKTFFEKPVFVKQLKINGKTVKEDLPHAFNYREFPI